MKPTILMAIVLLLSSTLITAANADTVVTKKTVTTITTTHTSCHNTHHKKHKRHHHHYYSCSSMDCYNLDYSSNMCPGGEFDCYWDLQNTQYRQTYLPINHNNNTAYSCLASEDPASCS